MFLILGGCLIKGSIETEPNTCKHANVNNALISSVTSKKAMLMTVGPAGSAALLFASLANRVHAFSPQVDLAGATELPASRQTPESSDCTCYWLLQYCQLPSQVYTWPSFATATVREDFRRRVQVQRPVYVVALRR